MGILNLFNKKTAEPRTDLVWIGSVAKLKGTLEYLKKNRADLCVAWFEDTRNLFIRHLNDENRMDIDIKMAGTLQLYDLNNKNAVFLEHYPVYSREHTLLSEFRPSGVCFLNSLDDPLFQLFGGTIASLMRGLGLGEEEFIENAMVSNAVIKAQKKLEDNILEDFHARSGQEWIDRYRIYSRQHLR